MTSDRNKPQEMQCCSPLWESLCYLVTSSHEGSAFWV